MSTTSERMAENAKEAMKLTRKYFVVELNYTPESLQDLEGVLDDYSFAMPDGENPQTVALLVRTWGGYLGEVVRRQLGGEWIDSESTVDESAGMTIGEKTIHPLEQVRRRLEEGNEHSLVEYFASLAK